jgi:4-diphosphocytidyl-2-C-methyl-D-erythritol kinase
MTQSLELALHALGLGTIADIGHNAMEVVVFAEYPELSVLKQRLLDAGCASALMSGSGPTIFGVCQNREHAEKIARDMPDTESSIVTSVPHGVQQIP